MLTFVILGTIAMMFLPALAFLGYALILGGSADALFERS